MGKSGLNGKRSVFALCEFCMQSSNLAQNILLKFQTNFLHCGWNEKLHIVPTKKTLIFLRKYLFVMTSTYYRPQTKFAKVMFLHLSVCPGGYPSMHCRWYPSMPCSRSGGGYTSMPCRFPGPHPWGKLRRIWPGWVSRPTPKGEVERIWPGWGSPGPYPGVVYPSMHWGRPPKGWPHSSQDKIPCVFPEFSLC